MYKVCCDGSFNSAATVVIRGVGSVVMLWPNFIYNTRIRIVYRSIYIYTMTCVLNVDTNRTKIYL